MEESFERTAANLKDNSGARLSNALENLKNNNVGLTFQFKMLEFMDTMNQNLYIAKEMRAQ